MKIIYALNIEDNLYKLWISLYFFLLVFFKANSVHFMMASIEDQSCYQLTKTKTITMTGNLEIKNS